MELKSASDVNKLLTSEEPSAIFFYMEGCGHCEAMKEPWKQMSKENPSVKFYKIESQNYPIDGGYPQFKFLKHASGQMSKSELQTALFGGGTTTKSGGRRNRTRRFTSRRRKSTK